MGGAAVLSWEQVDRWLAAEAERYDPESRTGFLIRQFRSYLPEAGITYFTGFDAARLAGLPEAFADLTGFLQSAAELFDRLGPALPAGVGEVRQARPEDLLAGYLYRDYAGGPLGAGNFLRIAFHLAQGELQLACWLGVGGAAHGQLRAALMAGDERTAGLRAMEPAPLLWLWSAEGEQQIPLADLDRETAGEVTWDRYTVAVQVGYSFTELGGDGLVERIGRWLLSLREALGSVLTGVVH